MTGESGGDRMANDLAGQPAAQVLKGSSILAALKASGIEYILSVPDIVTSRGLLFPVANDPDFKLIRVCKEDECLGIASGLAYGGRKALILVQHTGLLDSVNALRAVAVEFEQPICMMVGLLEKEPGRAPRQSQRYGVRIVEPLLEAMGIACHLIECEADVAKIGPAVAQCYARPQPVVFLVGRRPS